MASNRYSITEKVWIIRKYSQTQNATEVSRQWKKEFGTDPPSAKYVISLNNKFDETGTVADLPRTGRALSASTVENSDRVISAFVASPIKSVRRASLQLGISKSTVSRVLSKSNFKAYHPTLVQSLSEDDHDRRAQFCELWLDRVRQDPTLVDRILWTDESNFKMNGHVNRHNSIYWAEENPHYQIEVEMQSPGVTVWAGICSKGIIGPFFFEGTVNSQNYQNMLENFAIPKIEEIYGDTQIWFQQDGAPPHYANQVRQFLSTTFPGRWLGRRGPVEWPPRSCDLTPTDFFLWGYIKDRVYSIKPLSLQHLRQSIETELTNISPELAAEVCRSIPKRLQDCLNLDGWQVV